MHWKCALLTAVFAISACQGVDHSCEMGWERRDGVCVDPLHIYEPEERLDFDNVVGDVADIPDLPPPPRSGFRLVVAAIELEPYQEVVVTMAFDIPPTVNRMLYAAEIVPNPNYYYVHHMELLLSGSGETFVGVRTGRFADDFIHSVDYDRIVQEAVAGQGLETGMILAGEMSKCVGGGVCLPQRMALSEGYGMAILPDHKIVFGAHYLNPTDVPATPVIVFDFFTAPGSDIENEVVPFAFQVKGFQAPQESGLNVEGECPFPANMDIASLALVKQAWEPYRIELKRNNGFLSTLAEDEYGDEGGVLHFKPEPLTVSADDALRFSCTFYSPKDTPLVQGPPPDGVECMLMGWMTPPEAQVVGIVPAPGEPCQTHLIRQP